MVLVLSQNCANINYCLIPEHSELRRKKPHTRRQSVTCPLPPPPHLLSPFPRAWLSKYVSFINIFLLSEPMSSACLEGRLFLISSNVEGTSKIPPTGDKCFFSYGNGHCKPEAFTATSHILCECQ